MGWGGGLGLLDGIKAISAQISWRLAGWLGQSLSTTQNVKKASQFKITPRIKVSALCYCEHAQSLEWCFFNVTTQGFTLMGGHSTMQVIPPLLRSVLHNYIQFYWCDVITWHPPSTWPNFPTWVPPPNSKKWKGNTASLRNQNNALLCFEHPRRGAFCFVIEESSTKKCCCNLMGCLRIYLQMLFNPIQGGGAKTPALYFFVKLLSESKNKWLL